MTHMTKSKMRKMPKLLAAAAIALIAGTSFAGGTFREDTRDAELDARIKQGEVSGSLTPREIARLRHEQAEIRQVEWQSKRDGVVTDSERERVRALQDRLSEDISHEKHNGRVD
jgi:hypothetical protein